MTTDCVADNRFLHLLRKRHKTRAAALSTILVAPQRRLSAQEQDPSPPPHSQRPLRRSNLEPSNLSTHYLFSSSRPQNEIQNPYPNCFEGYPKLQRLTDLKKAMVYHRSHPPTSLKVNWHSDNLVSRLTWGLPSPIAPPAQGIRFDVIVISEQGGRDRFSDITQLASLPIESLAATPSFLFLWLPSSDSLEVGRALLQKWGFRRAEDIVWVKTNHRELQQWKQGGPMPIRRRREEDSTNAVFVRTKEHCLMGIRGTVRRSVDSHFIHCNIDTDVIIAEEPKTGSKQKPEELFNIVENFCMGRRRLEIFGSDNSMRPGWLTVGNGMTTSTYDAKEYLSYFQDGNLVGHHQEIEMLRPKSPVPKGQMGAQLPLGMQVAGVRV